MTRSATTDHPIHDLICERYSPYAFDPGKDVSLEDQSSLMEAARWAASSYNAQPWRYIVGSRSRNEGLWQAVLGVLVEANQAWAQHAPLLLLGCYKTRFDFNGKPNGCAVHDLGAASTSLTLEATARGLRVHQMAGLLPDKAKDVFDLPDDTVVMTALAVGYQAQGEGFDPERLKGDNSPRERLPISELVLKV